MGRQQIPKILQQSGLGAKPCPHDVSSDVYDAPRILKEMYAYSAKQPSSTSEHLPILRELAMECSSVVEIGLRAMVSTWGILMGLSEHPFSPRTYLGIDIASPPPDLLELAEYLAATHDITFTFWKKNDRDVDIPPAEMLFIDSLHTYCHLTYELETFAPKITKYIAMHDTSEPWGKCDDELYHGDYSEYPGSIDRNKRGLWPAVEDFLARHPEWTLFERRYNNHGFTVLRRKIKF